MSSFPVILFHFFWGCNRIQKNWMNEKDEMKTRIHSLDFGIKQTKQQKNLYNSVRFWMFFFQPHVLVFPFLFFILFFLFFFFGNLVQHLGWHLSCQMFLSVSKNYHHYYSARMATVNLSLSISLSVYIRFRILGTLCWYLNQFFFCLITQSLPDDWRVKERLRILADVYGLIAGVFACVFHHSKSVNVFSKIMKPLHNENG